MSKRHFTDYDQSGAPEYFDQAHFGGSVGGFFRRAQEDLVIDMVRPSKATVLDVATGTGRLSIPLARAGAHVTAIDASTEMLRRAREKAGGIQNIEFQLADAYHLPFPANKFEYVMSFRALMHFDDWELVLAELCRVSGKYVIFDVPPAMGAASLERFFYKLRSMLGHNVKPYNTFWLSSLRRELLKNGFEVERVEKQFVIPFKLHRKINSIAFTRAAERSLGWIGLEKLFGAPLTIKAVRRSN